MAGAFTHFIICDVAKSKRLLMNPTLWQLLNKHSQFLFLGAASPDLPYLSFKTGHTNWADVMHYEKTNSIVLNGHNELKKTLLSKNTSDEIKLIWLLGYTSHLIADATIHPIVQTIVGPYKENPEEHRKCEMTQDSLIFNTYKNYDISYAEFSSILKFCKNSEYFDELMTFWEELVLINYPEKGEDPTPSSWFKTYTEVIDVAEGGSDMVALFRHIGVGTNYLYMPKEEIILSHQEDYKKYYEEIKFPDGKSGLFQNDGFENAMNNVINAWNILYQELISDTIVVSSIIKNWNLDTGVDMDSPNKEVTYWA